MKNIGNPVPGILLCAGFAGVATYAGSLTVGGVSLGLIGAPVLAILFGMAIALKFPSLSGRDGLKDGIRFTSKKVLQGAVVILGFSLNINTVLAVGGKSFPVIVCTISVSLAAAYVMMRLLKVGWKTATLIGVGSSICGGSAIAAAAPVIDARDDEIAKSISVIFLFNVAAALIFPALGYAIGLGTEGFAVFAGTAVNDTSSVTAAAASAENIYGAEGILSAAVTVKLTRTLAIIPITLALSLYVARRHRSEGPAGGYSFRKVFPWFILLFVAASAVTTAVTGFGSGGFLSLYSDEFIPAAKWLAKFFIAMAMFAIGLNTNLAELVRNGGKPILLGFLCWIAIICTSLAVQYLTGIYSSDL